MLTNSGFTENLNLCLLSLEQEKHENKSILRILIVSKLAYDKRQS